MKEEKRETGMEILQPGFLTTVQDAGRFGYQSFGFSQSGVMDHVSYELGNRLLGNRAGEAALEMTWLGIQARFRTDATLVLTGAPMPAQRNGEPVIFGTPFSVKSGDILTIGAAERGCRAYLCVKGGIAVPVVMGSRSTNLKCGIGGFLGRRLQAGDCLEIGPARAGAAQAVSADRASATVPVSDPVVLRVIPDEQEELFTPEGIAVFYAERYEVTEESDRMGCRLAGPCVCSRGGSDIISEGIAAGAVQIPPSGVPIILMADRQTTGGYAKIGTVFTPDLSVLAQCRPGTGIRFQKITSKEAHRILQNGEKNETS